MFSAAASAKQLRRHNISLILFSAFYIFLSVVLIKYLETSGLIIANCLNMFVRIVYSLTFIHFHFKSSPLDKRSFDLKKALPNRIVIGIFVLSFAVTKASAEFFYTPTVNLYFTVAHILVGLLFFLITLGSIYFFEKEFLKNLLQIKKSKTA